MCESQRPSYLTTESVFDRNHLNKISIEMLKYRSILLSCLASLITINEAEIRVTVALDATFRLDIFPKALENATKCTLVSPMNVTTNIPIDYQTGDSQPANNEKIVPLGNNQCGARIHNAARSDAGKWTLTVSNADGKSLTEIFRMRTVTRETLANTTSMAVIGASGITIHCGPSSMLYCELRDPLGNLVTLTGRSRCETILNGVRATDFGTWKCTVGVTGSSSEIHATHTLEVEDPSEQVIIFSNKTSLGTLISWQVRRIIPAAAWCRAYPPNEETILVSPGLEVGKYVSAGTDLTENKCGLLIKNEFSQEYVGIWRLEMGLTSGRMIGGFIKMPEGEMPSQVDESGSDGSQTVEINVAVGKPFAVTCQTQYPAGYCWIKGPQGQKITSTNGLTLGKCSHSINNAVLNEHNGIWTCNMAHVNGGQEEHFITKVNVIDKLYRAVSPEITVRRGDKTVIACRTVLNCPLQYCRFVRPDGIGIGVTPGMQPSDRYSYEGPGLEHGYCGVAISSVEPVDFGEWTCVSRSNFRTWEEESWDTSILRAPETSVASVIGLTLGTVLLVLIGAGVFIIKNRRKRSGNSEESIIVEYTSN